LNEAKEMVEQARHDFKAADAIRKRNARLSISSPSTSTVDHEHNLRKKAKVDDAIEPLESEHMDRWQPAWNLSAHSETVDPKHVAAFVSRLKDSLNDGELDPEAAVSIVEAVLPSTFWEVASAQVRRCLVNTADAIIATPAIALSWVQFWTSHVPSILMCLLPVSMSPTTVLSGSFNDLTFARVISVMSTMMFTINNHCSHLLQQSVSMAFSCSPTRLQSIIYRTGICTTSATNLKHEKENIEIGNIVIGAMIVIAATIGFPFFIIFDNCDWNKRLDLAIHALYYILCLGWVSRSEAPFKACSLKDLPWTRLKEETELEKKANKKQQRIRLDLALTLMGSISWIQFARYSTSISHLSCILLIVLILFSFVC
jgi:hypothetical protein